LNGKKLCLAGVGTSGVVSTGINCILRNGEDEIFLDTGGINSETEEHQRWHAHKLRVGDEIVVRVVETPRADSASSRKPMNMSAAEQLRAQKLGVRQLAKRWGWKIQAGSGKAKSRVRKQNPRPSGSK